MISLVVVALMWFTSCQKTSKNETQTPAEPAATEDGLYGKYLTVEDIESITGLQGVTRREVNLTLEFYNAGSEKIVEARFGGRDFYEAEVGGNQQYYKPVENIGEKAAYILDDTPYRIAFLKGNYAVMVQTPFQSAKDPGNMDFLISVCQKVVERL